MSNLLSIETPAALQPVLTGAAGIAPSKTPAAPDILAGQSAGAAFSNRVADDVSLAAQGRLNNIRIIRAAMAEDEELKGAQAERAYFSYGPVMDVDKAEELINLSKSQILTMPSALVATSQSPQALLGLIR